MVWRRARRTGAGENFRRGPGRAGLVAPSGLACPPTGGAVPFAGRGRNSHTNRRPPPRLSVDSPRATARITQMGLQKLVRWLLPREEHFTTCSKSRARPTGRSDPLAVREASGQGGAGRSDHRTPADDVVRRMARRWRRLVAARPRKDLHRLTTELTHRRLANLTARVPPQHRPPSPAMVE